MQRTHHSSAPANLDPANLNPEEKKVLAKIFYDNAHLSFFSTERIFALRKRYHANVELYHLTKGILQRECNPVGKHPDELRYEIIDPVLLGAGVYGEVMQSLATISIAENGALLFKKPIDPKQRVIKKMIIGPKDSKVEMIALARYEYSLMKRMDHLHAKLPVFTSDGIYIVMRKMPGMNLYEFLKREKNGAIALSLSQYFSLALAIAKALQKQVHDKNIMHRDLGARNIMIERKGDQFIVNIIDFGLASDINEVSNLEIFRVTHQYIAPEMRGGYAPSSVKSDIYSLARAISEIFRFDSGVFSENVFASCKEQLAYEEKCGMYLDGMFQGIYGVDNFIAKSVYDLLKAMGHYQPDERISLAKVIKKLEKLQQYAIEKEKDIRCTVL